MSCETAPHPAPHPAAEALAGTEATPPAPEPAVLALSALLDQAEALQAAHLPGLRLLAQGLDLGAIDLPEPARPTRAPAQLGVLASLYLVQELEPMIRASERIAALWSSGAISVALPKLEPLLKKLWKERRQRLSGDERRALLAQAFDPQDFEPALARLCDAIVPLADNAGQHDVREEVGLQHAAQGLLEIAASRLEGMLLQAADELLGQLRSALQLLGDRQLQTAFGVRDLHGLVRAALVHEREVLGDLRQRFDRARAGSQVLVWLAQAASQGFAITPADPALQTLIAAAERWRLSARGDRPEVVNLALLEAF